MSAEAGTATPPPPKGVVPPTEPGGRPGFLSDVIVELGFATPDAVEEAVRAARSGSTVTQVLVEGGTISEEQLARAIAERFGIDYIDLDTYEVDPSAAAMIKPSAAKRYQAVPVGFVRGELLVAMVDPADALGVNDIAVMTKLEVLPAVAPRPALHALLDRLPLEIERAGEQTDSPEAEKPAAAAPAPSSAVFWQADEGDGGGESQALPSGDSAPVERSASAEEAERMRAELVELRRKLVGAETELVKARADMTASQEELTATRETATGPSAQQEQLELELAEAQRAADIALVRAAAADAELGTLREETAVRLAEIEAELARAREQAAAPRAEVEALREQLDAAQAELEKALAGADRAETSASQVDELRASLARGGVPSARTCAAAAPSWRPSWRARAAAAPSSRPS